MLRKRARWRPAISWYIAASIVGCQGTELLVHVGGARARIVAQPDSVLGNFLRLLLEDLTDRKDLGVSFLHLNQTANEIPEAGPRLGLGLGKKLDAVSLRVRVALGGYMAANDFVLMEQSHDLASQTAVPM